MTLRVGITGGIGSGKSAVTSRLEAKGISVVDADLAARAVVAPGQPALSEIMAHFGEGIIAADGHLDRAALRRIVFNDPGQRLALEAITHPRIREEIASQLEDATSPYVVLSSPLLLESGQSQFVDLVVVVDVPEAVQLARTTARDNNTEELVRQIMAAQLDRDTRLAGADIVIDNSAPLDALDDKVDALHTDLLARADADRAGSAT